MADCWINPLQYVKEVAECIVTEALCPPVKRHIDFWWCFDGNVQGLRDEIHGLEREMSNMNQKIEEARLDGKIPTTDVQNWSNEGTPKLEEATRILQGCDDLKVWNIIPRYSVGKSAKEAAEGIANLRNEGNSIRIADPAPPASMVPIIHAPSLEFQSRKSIEEGIMKSLKDGNVRMIAICGAGGVGKTTMAERMEDRVRADKLFDDVVSVVVSKTIDKLQIQKKIAEKLGLGLSEETLDGRAHKLRTRLMDSKKKLIIFDDVWENFVLQDIGVPYGGCKIILTSRNKDVCGEMEADEIFEIEVLDQKEAWTLFREKSGDCVDDLDLRPIAEEVAAECKGLPIALVTVGKALQKKNIKTWKDALSQLRRSNPTNFPQVLEKVYKPLKLSYDCLETESEKNLFLLCCLFPEDYDIEIEDLVLLSFGLGMFEGINNIEDGRNRTFNLLERLRSRFLLMTGRHEDEVKMHDVVRDVAIYIGSKEKKGFLNVGSMDFTSKDSSRNCNWMSQSVGILVANAKIPIGLCFSNLRLLMILNYIKFPEGFDINDICFKGMEELTVLYFSNQNIPSLPSSLKFLKNLKKLHLKNCMVKDISVVGELTSLEILRIFWCNDIEEVPADVGELKLLRLLELRECEKLKRIVAGVISSLVGLEELKIVGCFDKWEAKGNVSEERNASLSELESLCNLTSLEIDIFDPNLVAQEILLSKHLRRYRIHSYKDHFLFKDLIKILFPKRMVRVINNGTKHERMIRLYLPRDVTVGNWIRRLVKNTQSLALAGDGLSYFNLGEIESLRNVILIDCSTVEKLMNAVDCIFPMLEHLELRKLKELEEIIDGTIPEGSNFFQNLQSLVVDDLPKLRYLWKSPNQNVNLLNLNSIYIFKCPNLRSLFSMTTARSLVQLQSLEILFCDTMEKVLWNETESNTEASIIIEFPKLKELKLSDLPNLLAFTQGVAIIKFPQLIQLEIRDCPKLRTKIDEFPTCMIEKLRVHKGGTIKEIFRDDGNLHIIFQELCELQLGGLPCLTTFYRGAESIEFPKLKQLWFGNLPRLNSFVPIDSEPTHDHHSIHFFCNKKVEMIGLKELTLWDLPRKIRKIWCRHIPISFFHNLESLYIYCVDGIRNLISSSIAKALVNLNTLNIENCEEIIDVIEDETHVTVDSVFPNLTYLNITGNCNLRSFCQWKHVFELPSLEEVVIVDCPLIKTFALGLLSTPKLSKLRTKDRIIETEDLNGSITKITNEDENNDEYSEDESTEGEYSDEDQKETEGLRDEIRGLKREMSDRNQKFEEARLDGKSATTDVQKWSNEGTQKLEEATGILQGCDDLKVWNIIPRYLVRKSAEETAEGIAKLRNEGNSIRIVDPAPPTAMVPIIHAPTLKFQSRKSIEEDIMESLKDGNVRTIAICDAGNVGKTTMAQRIEDRVIKEKLFDEVVSVVVSQQIDKLQIQKKIAVMLGLGLSEETLDGRAHILRTRLMDSKKKLIIFDDVWESFELKEIGVPYANGDGGCKIILTSRDKDLCEEMEADKVIEIVVLDKKEAWTLFREKSGDCVDDIYLRPIAEEVAEECKGLPIALATVGIALKNKNLKAWKEALLQLRRANPTNFPQVLENVYTPLKLSYDFLETDEKNLFLLCCFFPEDYDIQIEDLALLSFGLRLFKGINNIEDGRNRTYHLLERLRSRFLLMTGRHEHIIKMHDVVRDVAIFIGSKEKQGFLNVCSMDLSSKDSSRNCNWMSVDISVANAKLPIGLDFPNLRLLMILNSSDRYPEGLDVNDICFEGMKELTVLYFLNQNIPSLPSSLKFLKKLRKLHLKNCMVKDVSVVGELASLEILRIFWCNDIEEVPSDVGKLKFLRFLELWDCEKLKRIVAGVISSLVGLEELKIVGCFNEWEAKGIVSEERNASLSELESLPNLTSLEIDIFDPNLFAQEILLSKHLKRYRIRFLKGLNLFEDKMLFIFIERKIKNQYEKKVRVYLPKRDVTVGNWIRRLVKNTESLELDGDGSNNFNLGETESLRNLVFQNCSTVGKLVNAVACKFPMLEHLELRELKELEEIIDGTIPEGSNSFQNLESLYVSDLPKLRYLWKSPNQNVNLLNLNSIFIFKCPNLRYLFSMATARSLVQLQSLEISFCDTMEQVLFPKLKLRRRSFKASIIEFPKLKKLRLYFLPSLLAFTQGVEIIKFPQLIQLDIQDCPKLRIKIDKCPTCMIEKLLVGNCDSIEEIFRDDGNRHIIFQELYQLELTDLPCLTTFYGGVDSIKFPKLKELKIGKLPRLNSFVAIDSEPTHGHHSLHFFCNKKVEMIDLKKLHLWNLSNKISKIWCRHIPISFFHNLENLNISIVDGIRNSISSSIAKALVNLNRLCIKYCNQMVDVIGDETGVPVNSVFPNLVYLEITDNCKLRSFCKWKHAFELPSLHEVQIDACPLMKTFTLGLLSTPKLSKLQTNGRIIETEDLNSSMHHVITKIKNKDEYSEDEYKDENKDEYSEDEYSDDDQKEIEGEEKTESSNNINLM